MFQVKNVTKYFDDVLAVDNISFSAKTGDIIGFLGPNGAGKSTTMRIIAGYFVPNSGDVILKDVSIIQNPEEFKEQIGYMPENNPLFLDMTVVEQIRFVKSIRKSKFNSKKVDEYLKRFGLEDKLYKKIGELSKGYRQRLGMLIALIHDPYLLILDEPNEGLDPNQREEIRSLIRELAKEKIIIISTHVLQEVESICNKVVIISQGRVQQEGNIEDLRLLRNNQTIHTIKLSDKGDFEEKFKSYGEIRSKKEDDKYEFVIAVKEDQAFIDEFNKYIKASKAKLFEFRSEKLSIADLFKELTTNENQT